MACKVTIDPAGDDDFLAPTGSNVTLCFSSDDGLYRLAAATYDGQPLVVAGDSCVTFTVKAGRKLLALTQVCPNPATTVQIFEDCGDGTKQKLGERPFQDLEGYRIRGL